MPDPRKIYDLENMRALVNVELVGRHNRPFTLKLRLYVLAAQDAIRKLKGLLTSASIININSKKKEMLACTDLVLKALNDCKKGNVDLKPENYARVEVEEGRWLQLAALIKETKNNEMDVTELKAVAGLFLERCESALAGIWGDIVTEIKKSA